MSILVSLVHNTVLQEICSYFLKHILYVCCCDEIFTEICCGM